MELDYICKNFRAFFRKRIFPRGKTNIFAQNSKIVPLNPRLHCSYLINSNDKTEFELKNENAFRRLDEGERFGPLCKRPFPLLLLPGEGEYYANYNPRKE